MVARASGRQRQEALALQEVSRNPVHLYTSQKVLGLSLQVNLSNSGKAFPASQGRMEHWAWLRILTHLMTSKSQPSVYWPVVGNGAPTPRDEAGEKVGLGSGG